MTIDHTSHDDLVDDLLATVDRYRPELIERGAEIDDLRSLPQDLADRLAADGFYRLMVPAELGGLDIGPVALCQICERLAAANGSVAWCVFIGASSQYLFSAVAPSQLDKLLEDPDVITCGVFADSGTVVAQEREGQPGYLVNGIWRWASGCHNAAWISGGIHEIDDRGEPVERDAPFTRVFFRPHEIDIKDSWHVSGLRGTGSSDYEARDVWVPAERLATTAQHSPYADRPIFRFPRLALLGIPIGAIALGMARSSLDEVLGEAGAKTPQGSRRPLSARPALHLAVARADVELNAARAWFYQTVEEAWAEAHHADESLAHRTRLRTANVHALDTAVGVIDRMYTIMGGSSVFSHSCLQRNFRDVHVASQHMMVAEPVLEVAGRVMVGIDDRGVGL